MLLNMRNKKLQTLIHKGLASKKFAIIWDILAAREVLKKLCRKKDLRYRKLVDLGKFSKKNCKHKHRHRSNDELGGS